MSTIQTTITGRIHVTNSPGSFDMDGARVPSIHVNRGPVLVRLWVNEWYNREAVHRPVYFSLSHTDCNPKTAPMLPMDGTIFKLHLNANNSLWLCGEDNVLVSYAIDPIVPGVVL